jgi:hypothetical protein
MTESWLDELMDATQRLPDATLRALYVAYVWAREWQPLLAGLLVVIAAIIVARAIIKTTATRAPHPRVAVKDQAQLDLRLATRSAATTSQVAPDELFGNLEQLRSLIRSAMASFTLATENENSPAHFLCQRIARLRLEQVPLPSSASKTARELHATLLQQLELLRLQLNEDAQSNKISEILVQLNGNARNLMAALAPASDKRRQAKSDSR